MNIKKIVKIIILIAFISVICIFTYVLSMNKKINLPKMDEFKEIILKENDKIFVIDGKKDIENIYKILKDKKSIKKSIEDTPKGVKSFVKISFVINDSEKNKMNIYTKNDSYYIEEPYNRIFKLSKEEYENIVNYISSPYTIGKLSNYNITNDKIIMEIKEDSSMNKKINLTIKNMTNKIYEYGEEYFIEIKKDGGWYKLKWVNEPEFNLILHLIKGEETTTDIIDVSFKDLLGKGKYRLVKSFSEKNATEDIETVYAAAEFEIK